MATRTKRYSAELKNLDHLLQVIEDEMGSDAKLETREFTQGGVMGIGGKKMIEIIASVDVHPSSIGSGIRRTIRLGDDWSTVPRDTGQPAATGPAAEEDRLVDLSKRAGSSIPIGSSLKASTSPRVTTPVRPGPPVEEPKPVFDQGPAPLSPKPTTGAVAPEPVAYVHEPVFTAPEYSHVTKSEPESILEPEPVADWPPQPVVKVKPQVPVPEQAPPVQAALPEPQAAEPEVVELKPVFFGAESAASAELASDQLAAEPEPVPDLGDILSRLRQEPVPEGGATELEESLGLIKSAVQRIIDQPVAAPAANGAVAAVQRAVYDQLVDWNIRSADALKLIDAALGHYAPGTEPTERGLLEEVTSEMLRPVKTTYGIEVKPGQRKVVAFAGPTGSGKTSVIAKLAARFAFQQELKVGLISMDTYRIAAAEQLRTYADIMGFTLAVAFSADEYAQAVAAMDTDVVLVDTAGRSPTHRNQIDDLRAVLAACQPDELHLVLPATMRADDLRLALDAFAPVGFNRVIVTKLDETRALSMLYNLSQLTQVPVSYFSTGQGIPDDLHEAAPGFIAGWAESLQ